MPADTRALERRYRGLPRAPAGKRIYYGDTKVRGLQLVVTDRGAKSFYFYKRIRGKLYRNLLGKYLDLSPENARKRAHGDGGSLRSRS